MANYRNFYIEKNGKCHKGDGVRGSAASALELANKVMNDRKDFVIIHGNQIKKKNIREIRQEIDNDQFLELGRQGIILDDSRTVYFDYAGTHSIDRSLTNSWAQELSGYTIGLWSDRDTASND